MIVPSEKFEFSLFRSEEVSKSDGSTSSPKEFLLSYNSCFYMVQRRLEIEAASGRPTLLLFYIFVALSHAKWANLIQPRPGKTVVVVKASKG